MCPAAGWVVRRPTLGGGPPRLLIVDDVRPVNTLNFRTDTLWTNGAVRNLPPGTWSVLRLEFTQPFRSAKDVEQTFRQYDSVIWYRGTENNFALTLSQIQDGIGAAMDGGTSVLIEGLNLLGVEFATGPLRLDFISRYFETDYLYKHFMAGMVDSSITWGVPIGGVFRSGPVIPTDSLRIQIIASGLHGFALADTHDVLLWARAGTLSQPHSFDVPVAISVPQASGATATLVTLPVVATSAPSNIQRATIFVNNVFQHVLRFGP